LNAFVLLFYVEMSLVMGAIDGQDKADEGLSGVRRVL